jgi:hypothetical protein
VDFGGWEWGWGCGVMIYDFHDYDFCLIDEKLWNRFGFAEEGFMMII